MATLPPHHAATMRSAAPELALRSASPRRYRVFIPVIGLLAACAAPWRIHRALGNGIWPRACVGVCNGPQAATKFLGVSWQDRTSSWEARVQNPANGDTISLGSFTAAKDAAQAFDIATLALSNETDKLNFPRHFYINGDVHKGRVLVKDLWLARHSGYHNVFRNFASNKWKAEVKLGHGRKKFWKKQLLGMFETQVEAAQAADTAVRSTRAPRALQLPQLNFRQDTDYFDEDTWEDEKIPQDATSCFVGVTYHQPSDQFLARIGRKHVGLFDSEIDAAKAFDEVSAAKGGVTNFKPVDQASE